MILGESIYSRIRHVRELRSMDINISRAHLALFSIRVLIKNKVCVGNDKAW